MNATQDKTELAEIAKRVIGYVRARQLLSNVDAEEISEVTVTPPGGEPMTFALNSSDLEALAAPYLDPRCTGRVPDVTGLTESRVCGLTLTADGHCPRPELDHVR